MQRMRRAAVLGRTAAQRDGCSLAAVNQNHRTALARTWGEKFFAVLLVLARSSQELEPPANSGPLSIDGRPRLKKVSAATLCGADCAPAAIYRLQRARNFASYLRGPPSRTRTMAQRAICPAVIASNPHLFGELALGPA
jgi:hypothetical protein